MEGFCQCAELADSDFGWVAGEGVHGDLVGTGVEVFTYSGRDGVRVTPRHKGVDQAVAAAVAEIILGNPRARAWLT